MRWMLAFSMLAAAALTCPPASGQSAAPVRLSAAEQTSALQVIQSAFREQYVFEQMRPAIVERLQAAQASGRYAVAEPAVFAERVTEDLRQVTHDKHLALTFDPAGYAAALTEDGEEGQDAYWRRLALRNHHGLGEMKVLGGNLRYLKIDGFFWLDDATGPAYDGAMRFLADGDAIVIDIRGNGGGSHQAVRYLVSHFLRAGTLEMTFLEGSEAPEQSRALDYLPAGRLLGKPLYVLIDVGAASAAEAFAYDVQQFKLGELVGEKTVGAANNNRYVAVVPGFVLSISYGRPVHPVSGKNWEGEGVEPTVAAPSARALEVAQALALQRLAEQPNVAAQDRAEYQWAKVAVDARLDPVRIVPARMKSLAGRYGNIEVTWRDDALWLNRPDRPTARLMPLTADGLFALHDNDRVRVRLTDRAMELWRVGEPEPRILPRGTAAKK